MSNQYSIQQLSERLSEVLKYVRQDNSIEITQEGETIAVIIGAAEYQRLIKPKSSFWQSLQQFRQQANLEELGNVSDVFTGVRDRSPGREVTL